MKDRLVWPFVGVGAGAIGFGVWKIFERFPMMPQQASAEAVFVDGAWNGLLVVEGTIYALVMAFLAYCLFRFRSRRPDDAGERFDRSRGRFVEAAWIGASAMLTLGLAAMGAHELRAVVGKPEADHDIEIRAQQFSWEFYYPRFNQFGAKLYLEKGKRHRLILTSKDVVHSFWVPEFRLKQDAVPGKIVPLIITPTKAGDYTLMCAELCGLEHTEMTSMVSVLEHEEFENALKAEF